MPINVSEALDMDTGQITTVERGSGGTFADGKFIPGATPTTFKALISTQQPTPQDLQKLPEGERIKDIRKFISNKPLFSTKEAESKVADVVVYDGFRFKIIQVGDWNAYGHTTAMGARET